MDESARLEISFDEQSGSRVAQRAEDAVNKGATTGAAEGGKEIAAAARQFSQAAAQLSAQLRGGGGASPSGVGSRRGASPPQSPNPGPGMSSGDTPEKASYMEAFRRNLFEKRMASAEADAAARLETGYGAAKASAGPQWLSNKKYIPGAQPPPNPTLGGRRWLSNKKYIPGVQPPLGGDNPQAPCATPPTPPSGPPPLPSGPPPLPNGPPALPKGPPPLPNPPIAGRAGLGRLLQQALGGRAGQLAGGLANLLGGATGGSSVMGGVLGSLGGGAAGGVAGLAGGPIGAAVQMAVQNLKDGWGMAGRGVAQAGRSLVSGDTSGFMKGGIGAVGGMASAGAGPILGPIVRKGAESLQQLVGFLDDFTSQVAEFNGNVAAKQADLDAATMGFQMKMADAGEGLASSWLDLKMSVLSLMEDLMPVIEIAIDILKGFVDAVKDVVDFVHQFVPSSGKPRSADIAAAANAGMVSDLNVNGDPMPGAGGSAASAGSGPGTFAGLGGGGGRGSSRSTAAPSYRLPGGNGTGFHLHQTNQFAPQDQASVEMVLHQLREMILDPMRAHGDRVTVMGGMMGARMARDLAG